MALGRVKVLDQIHISNGLPEANSLASVSPFQVNKRAPYNTQTVLRLLSLLASPAQLLSAQLQIIPQGSFFLLFLLCEINKQQANGG